MVSVERRTTWPEKGSRWNIQSKAASILVSGTFHATSAPSARLVASSVCRTRRIVLARSIATMRAITTSTSTPECRAISSKGWRAKPSILSSETARIFALIGSLCSTGSMWINPPVDSCCPITGFATRKAESIQPVRPLSPAAGENGKKMAARTDQDEQVPDEMTVAQALIDKKEHTRGVGNSARHKPKQCRERNCQRHRASRKKRQPPGAEIKSHRKFRMLRSPARRLQEHAKNREWPNKCENGGSPEPAKRAKCERRVGTGNQ